MATIETKPTSSAQEFLLGRIDYERMNIPKEAEYFKLTRMRHLLQLLGNPQDQLPIIHVSGTKGKGSTAAMIAAMLEEAGKQTGLYTSPHVHRVEERIVAKRRMITPQQFDQVLERIRPAVVELDARDAASELPIGGPTFFEIVNAAAMLWFAEQKLGAAVIEVGLGGRLDSTNVCNPKVTVITSIGLDHMKQLGSTLAQIAIEKAGIIKPGVPCVTGVTEEEPLDEIRQIAEQQNAPLYIVEEQFRFDYKPPAATTPFRIGACDYFDLLGNREFVMRDLQLPMLGAHQAANAAVAIAATRLFLAESLPVSPKVLSSNAIRGGVAKGVLPARMQVVQQSPAIVVDAAHNEPSMKALVAALAPEFPRFRKKTALLSISRDKSIEPILAAVLGSFDEVIFTRFIGNPRACDPQDLATQAQSVLASAGMANAPQIKVFDRPDLAWDAIRAELGESDLLCVAGSFFIAGEFLDLLKAR